MSDKEPTSDAIPPKERPLLRQNTSAVAQGAMADKSKGRPPFNEVSVLFPLLSFYTAGYMGLMIADFFLKRSLNLPDGIMTIYIALLGAYAADKEIRRWFGTPEPPRKGSVFVYLWLLFALAVFIVHSFRADYFLPNNLTAVCLQVLGIFFGSRASKYVYQNRSAAPADLTEVVLALIREQGWCSRKQIEEKLGISERSANRLLAGIEAKGLIRREGEGKAVRYFAVSPLV